MCNCFLDEEQDDGVSDRGVRNALQLGAVNTDRSAAATAEVEKRIWNCAMRSVSAKALSLHATASVILLLSSVVG